MKDLEERDVQCPYCGERITLLLDGSQGEQGYYEDCSVCCRPIDVTVSFDTAGSLLIAVRRDDE